MSQNHLTHEERIRLAALKRAGFNQSNIAKELGRHRSTISRELNRNVTSNKSGYDVRIAQEKTDQRRFLANQHFCKIETNLKTKNYIKQKLKRTWSPEQIAGRLKRLRQGETLICHETIYRKRRPWYGRCLYRRGIANRVSISLRPEEINTKKTFGHWEADVVEGKAHRKGIQTLLERKTRFYQAKILPIIDSEFGVKAQRDILESFAKKARKSVTFDNGKENYNCQGSQHLQ